MVVEFCSRVYRQGPDGLEFPKCSVLECMGKVLVVRREGLPAVGEIELGTRKRDRHQGSEIKAFVPTVV